MILAVAFSLTTEMFVSMFGNSVFANMWIAICMKPGAGGSTVLRSLPLDLDLMKNPMANLVARLPALRKCMVGKH